MTPNILLAREDIKIFRLRAQHARETTPRTRTARTSSPPRARASPSPTPTTPTTTPTTRAPAPTRRPPCRPNARVPRWTRATTDRVHARDPIGRVESRPVESLCVTSHDPSTRPVPRPRVHANELDSLDRSTRLDSLDRSTRLDSLDRSTRVTRSTRLTRSIDSTRRTRSIDRLLDRLDSSRVRSRERTPRLWERKNPNESRLSNTPPPPHTHPPPPMAAGARRRRRQIARVRRRDARDRPRETRVTSSARKSRSIMDGANDAGATNASRLYVGNILEHHGGGSSRSLRRLRGRSRRGHSHGRQGRSRGYGIGVCHGGRRARGGESHGRYVGRGSVGSRIAIADRQSIGVARMNEVDECL